MFKNDIAKQIIDFQKTTFDTSFGAIVMLQDRAQEAFNNALEQTPWVPRETKKVIDEWIQISKTGRNEFKSLVDGGFDTLTGFYATDAKPAPKATGAKKQN